MKETLIDFQKIGKVAVMSINMDMLTKDDLSTMSYEFCDVCTAISSDAEINIVQIILKGEKSLTDRTSMSSYSYIPSIVECISKMDIPVIIAMDGCITGLALELALACDIRIATPASSFGFPEINEGGIPSNGGTQRLPRIVGKGKAMEMILTGCLMDADTGHQLGLVNRIAKKEELESMCMELARDMSEKSLVSMMYTKEAINKGMDMTLEQGIRLEADLYFLMHTTHDRSEGIRAFQEKRPPEFKGE